MYDRTPRTLGQTVGCTPAHVGPGAYHHHRQKQQQEDGYAPFLSLSNRSEVSNSDEKPGPGYYDLPSPKVKVSDKFFSFLLNTQDK
ncbi:unnamed protein product [Adineta ricciae]|uniref:Uncharacterized protein n=1 Tax=Adineta ricciae TaxID=249248 RepID=A0A815HET6_ADIRI|nr:unnamed protein product [Adineta ricciae]CAF1351343.1 unnamed protein product [Adineta ricciae]